MKGTNGFIWFHGGLHVRGVCDEPEWHSLEAVWRGTLRLSAFYPAVEPSDIPFAQDCVGDQFLLREGRVLRLEAELGDLTEVAPSLHGFLKAAKQDPVATLLMQPLLEYQRSGNHLEPGRILHAYPPFCTKEAKNGLSLKDVPVQELILFHADFASQVGGYELPVER